jgi:capsular polysaccharide biosynthesis protein
MVKRQADADVATELDRSRISNVSILTPPSPTLTPVYPRKLLIMGVLLPVGLMLGIGLALLMHYAGGAVGDPREIESALGIPCLGEVSLKPRLLL